MFKFKEFTIKQDKAAMKVGTDAVLLGAWASLTHVPEKILDIGTGTGVIALQLAQRSGALQIDAVEMDDNAYEQAVDNFEDSAWGDRLFCYHANFNELVEELQGDELYNLIVCNPPYFSENYKTNNTSRDLARFQDALPFTDLVSGVSELLSEDGQLAVIIPFSEERQFCILAEEFGLYLKRYCHIKGHVGASIKRSLLEFSRQQTSVEAETLVIETTRHNYTKDYMTLVKDFYLKM